jgi:hypothetical protein
MMDDLAKQTAKIRALEALALRPGTPEEGEMAKLRAIEHSKKYGIPSIFTSGGPIPKPEPSKPRPYQYSPPKPEAPRTLHKTVADLEESLKNNGWTFRFFHNGQRIYKNTSRPEEEILMSSLGFGQFSCNHFYLPSYTYRPVGQSVRELENFFGSVAYRYELWPLPMNQRHRKHSQFYEDPIFGNKKAEEPQKAEPIVEETVVPPKPPEPEPEPIDPVLQDKYDRIDYIDEMLRQPLPSLKEDFDVVRN